MDEIPRESQGETPKNIIPRLLSSDIEVAMDTMSDTDQQLKFLDAQISDRSSREQEIFDHLDGSIFSVYQMTQDQKNEFISRFVGEEEMEQMFDPGYDILSKGNEYFEAELAANFQHAEEQNKTTTYNTYIEELEAIQKVEPPKSTSEIIQLALESGQLADDQLAKFEQFQAILSPDTITNEIDRKLIAQSINGLDISTLPDPVLFVQHSIYGNEAISESTKVEIQKKLNIPRLSSVETASDALNVLDSGYVDKNGLRQELTKDHPAAIDNYTTLYTSPNGDGVMNMIVPDGRQFILHFNRESGAEAIGNRMLAIRVIMATESLALAQPIFRRGYKITHGGEMDIHYDDVIKAKKVTQSLLGDTAGFDGKILGEAEINRLKHQYQAFRKEGDRATGDNDPARAEKDFQELGIVSGNGDLDWAKFDQACRYIQQNNSQGNIPDFYKLKAHLDRE